MNILNLGRALDLDDVPSVFADRIQYVCTGITAVEGECRFIKRTALFEGFLRKSKNFAKVVNLLSDLDAAGKQFLRQFSDLMTLIENGLLLKVGSRD